MRVDRSDRLANIGRYVFDRYRKAAIHAVRLAVQDGRLPRPSGLTCADCGECAAVYEHRDYALPMVVQAVCDRCNHQRGMADLSLKQLARDLSPYWGGGQKARERLLERDL